MGMFSKQAPPAKKAAGVVKKAPSKAVEPTPAKHGKMFGKTVGAKKVGAAKKTAAPAKKSSRRDDGEDVIGGAMSGWGGAAKMRSEHSDYANRLQMKDGESIPGWFVDNAPYATVATHWFSKRKGRKSFQCLGMDNGCPLCAVGDKPKLTYNFNFAALTEGEPMLYSWEVGKRLFDDIKKLAEHPKYKPLSKMFYEVSRSGSGINDTKYTITPYKRVSDLEEEYEDFTIPDTDEREAFVGYTLDDALKQRASISEMQEVAEEITGGGYDEDDDDE